MISPAFKAGDSVLRGSNGGFDSHTLPPIIFVSTTYPRIFLTIGHRVLGNVVHALSGEVIQGSARIVLAGVLLYMTRPQVRSTFVTKPK